MAMPPMLRWALSRVPMRKAEKERLEREEFEARGFVSNLERLLVAVDESPNGKFVASLAGLLAGTCRIPITVLPLAEEAKHGQPDAKSPGDRVEEMVKTAAGEIKPGQRRDEDAAPVDVTVRRHDASTEEAVAQEAKKGYDLLFVGVENTRAKNGAFHADVSRIAAAFAGPLAIVAGNGDPLDKAKAIPARILVPVTGSEVSRRAAEVAIAIAGACERPITALLRQHARRWPPAQSRRFPRPPAGASDHEGDRRDCRPLRRDGEHRNPRRPCAARRHPDRGEKTRARSYRHGGESPLGR
jgi:nucleotide-binding universal stress UspA family protein